MLLTVDLERLSVGPGDLVLDAGCGEGRHCFGCLERGARVVGLDLDRTCLRRSVARTGMIDRHASTLERKLRCESMTPFGSPVVPEV